jgi:hypothetical protein
MSLKGLGTKTNWLGVISQSWNNSDSDNIQSDGDSERPVLSSKMVPHTKKNNNCLTVTEIQSWAPDGCLTPKLTGRLTVGRNGAWTWTTLSPCQREWMVRSTAVFSQRVYTERPVPHLDEEEPPLLSCDRSRGHTNTRTGRRSHNPTLRK